MGLYEDALSFCAWLRPAEWLDTLGPNQTAKLMEIPRATFGSLNSPIDMTLLNRFAKHSELNPDSPVYQVMCMVKNDVIASNPSFGIFAFIAEQNKADDVHALVYPDRRGEGYGLTRYEDCQRLNFSKIENQDDVRFAHKRGFVAKRRLF